MKLINSTAPRYQFQHTHVTANQFDSSLQAILYWALYDLQHSFFPFLNRLRAPGVYVPELEAILLHLERDQVSKILIPAVEGLRPGKVQEGTNRIAANMVFFIHLFCNEHEIYTESGVFNVYPADSREMQQYNLIKVFYEVCKRLNIDDETEPILIRLEQIGAALQNLDLSQFQPGLLIGSTLESTEQ